MTMSRPKPASSEFLVATPLYRQVEERLAADIYAGRYRSGDRLPSDAELGAGFGVSRITIRHALDRLVAANLIRRQQGVGSFVLGGDEARKTASLVGDIDEIHPHIHFRLLSSDEAAPSPELAALLPAPAPEAWTRYVCVNHTGRQPLSYVIAHFPAEVARWLSAEDFRGHVPPARLLEMRAGMAFAHADQTMSAVLAPEAVARHLGLPAGAPIMRMERAYFAADGQVMEATTAYYHPDRYRYAVRLVRGSAPGGKSSGGPRAVKQSTRAPRGASR